MSLGRVTDLEGLSEMAAPPLVMETKVKQDREKDLPTAKNIHRVLKRLGDKDMSTTTPTTTTTTTVTDKIKAAFKAALEGVRRAAIAARNYAALALGVTGRAVVWVFKEATDLVKWSASTIALGLTIGINYTTVAFNFALNALAKAAHGFGLVLATPLLAINHGWDGVHTAWSAYLAMWTRAWWDNETPTAVDVEGNVYDIFTGRVVA